MPLCDAAAMMPPRQRRRPAAPLADELMREVLSYLKSGELREAAFVHPRWFSYVEGSAYLRRVVELQGVFAVGGWDGYEELQTAEIYTPAHDEWLPLPKMRTRRSHVGCAVVDRRIYVVGGRDGNTRLATGEVYDPFAEVWTDLPSMVTQRSSLALRSVGKYLFAFGGYNGKDEHRSNEAYNTVTREWAPIAPLPAKRSQMASAALDEHVYLLGGCRNQGKEILNEAHRYNAERDVFEPLAGMHEKRLSGAATILNGLVYALGGSDDCETHQSIECYDPRCNTWTCAAALPKMRVNLGCATYEDTIIVVGGYHGNQLKQVDRFFPAHHPRYQHVVRDAVAVVEGEGVPGGAWMPCRELTHSRDAVSACVFE
eukprot:TRINITY_DN16341_c0_g1_i1.p2 TRINITY_DN16341_c0_g1~~TRINITY_DN16341_c0_g1_i1.p2  ORF type:complete len:371 (+),score=125.72 TRINITY_DN16341_c0_g1_i1:133-1245(+)